MASISESVRPILSDLRRYASALTGDRRTGDWYVRITLETLLQEPFRVRAEDDVKFQLYKLFGSTLAVGGIASGNNQDAAESDDVLKQNFLALPLLTRHLFLLVTLEGFSVKRAAELLGMTRGEAVSLLAWARKQALDPLEMPTDMLASSPRALRNHGSKSAAQTSWRAPLHQPATGQELAAVQ
jgi:DNA-directed RNA polymerase specialized sigma24 family protein